MHHTKVKTADLLAKVRANRAGHREVFEKAQVGYRAACIAELDAMLAEARSGKRIRRNVTLVEPQDHTRDYDRAIAMLEMSVDGEVDLDANLFQNLVLDEWGWTDQFVGSTARYSE